MNFLGRKRDCSYICGIFYKNMNKRLFGVLIFLSSLWCLQNSYAQCAVDPGDRDISMYNSSQIVSLKANGATDVGAGKVLRLTQSGTYTLHINGGAIIASAPGVYTFSTGCTYNSGCELYVNEGAKVIIQGDFDHEINLVNRGEITFERSPYGGDNYVNFNSNSNVINVGKLNVLTGFRLDGAFSNLSEVNVSGSIWLNSNRGICLANGSIMNVQGSSHINSAIYGDGGCLHSVGRVSLEDNYVVNSGNKITPDDQLIYVCAENGFSSSFHYNPNASENHSGGAVLQDNCQGCPGGGGGGGGGGTEEEFSYGIQIYGDTIVCQNESTSLSVNVSGKENGAYTYRWVKVVDGKEYALSSESGASRLTVYPTEMTKYRVYVTENGTQIGSKDVIVYVLKANVFLSQKEPNSVVLTASLADSYHWSTGATTPSVIVPVSETTRTYSVDLTKDSKTCTASVVVNNQQDRYDDYAPLQVILNGPASICQGSGVHLSTVVSGGSGNYSYEWNTGATTDSITDTPLASSDYCVKVVDLDLGLEKTASAHVHVPVIQVLSNSTDVITFLLDGVRRSISPMPEDSMLSVWVDGGASCKVKLYGGVPSGTDPHIVVVSHNDTLLTENDTVYICKGQSILLAADDSSQTYTYRWLGLNSSSSSVEVSPAHTTTYTLTANSLDSTVRKISKVTVVVRGISTMAVSTESRSLVILLGEGGSNYVWTNVNLSDPSMNVTYTGNPFVYDYSSTYDYTAVTIDDVCNDTFRFEGTYRVDITDRNDSLSTTYSNSYVCLNGSQDSVMFDANVSGGTGLLSFEWYRNDVKISTDPSIKVKETSSAEYKVVVTDNGTNKKTVATRYVFALSAKINKQNDQTAQLVATGGGDYHWSTGENTQSIVVPANVAGTYTVSVTRDDHQCSASVNVQPGIVTVPDSVEVMISSSSTASSICEGESIVLRASGTNGSGRYLYSWNIADTTQNHANQIVVSPRESRTYVVHVRDLSSGATGTDSFRVNVLSVDVDSFSVGNSIRLFARGGVSYLWSTNDSTSYITVPRTTNIASYSVLVTDEFGKTCKQSIDVRESSIPSGDIPYVTISGPSSVCQGDTIELSASLSTGCDSCIYQWVNRRAYSMANIRIVPRHTETYTVNVLDPATNREYTASFRVEVMKANVVSYVNNGSAVLTASGGSSYLWSNGAQTSSIVVPATDSVYSVVITQGNVSCEKTVSIPDPYKLDSLNIRIVGNTEICPNTSTNLTVKIGDNDSYYEDFDVRWVGFPNAGRSIDVSPSQSQTYKALVYYRPTGKIYSTLTASVVVLQSCHGGGGGGDSIPDIFVPTCGDHDLNDGSYRLTDGVAHVLSTSSTNVFSSGNSYQAVVTEAGKTYVVDLNTGASAYIYSDVATSLNMNKFNGTLILDGSGPFTFVERSGAKYLSMSKQSKLIVNRGTNVIIASGSSSSPVPAKMNEEAQLYNRGIVTVQGKFTLNNQARLVNMGSFRIEYGLTLNDAACNVTNYNLMDIDRLEGIMNSRTGMFALESGSVTKFRRIKNVTGETRPFCGNGCVHITGQLEGINVSHLASASINVCQQLANDNLSSKWGAAVTPSCSGCGFSLIPINKVICDTSLGNRDTARLEVRVIGGSGSYTYTWLDPISQQDSTNVGGPLYPISTLVNVPTSLTEDYSVTRRLVVRDAATSFFDTVSVSYTVLKCGSGDTPSSDSVRFEVRGEDYLCLGNRTSLSVRLTNTPSGFISYRWSTDEKTDRIIVSPTETTTYWVDVTCVRGGDTMVVRKDFKVVVHECGVEGCASDLWVNIDEYPDCGANGALSVSSTSASDSSYVPFMVKWFDSNFNVIDSSYTLRNVPAGIYYVQLDRAECSVQRQIKLSSVDNRDMSGLTMTLYGEQSGDDDDDSPCVLDKKTGSSRTSSLSSDLSTIAADYVIWSGFITPSCDGLYYFQSNVSGGNLFVNNEKILSGDKTLSDPVDLRAGASYMIAYVKERSGNEGDVNVMWITPCSSSEAETIPSCALTPDPLVGLGYLLKEKSDIPSLNSALDNCSSVTPCPTPVVNMEPLRQICKSGSSITLSAYTPGATYQWRDKRSQRTISDQASISVTTPGAYTVDVTSWCGSKIQKDVLVQSLNESDITATASTTTACSGSVVNLKATGGDSYQWTPSSGLSNASSANPSVTVDRSVTYTVKIHTAGGCMISKSVQVAVMDPFDFEVTQEFDECNGSVLHMSADGADQYIWTPSEGLSCSRCSATDVRVGSEDKEYTVEGMKDGCVLKKIVKVRPLLKQRDLDFSYEGTSQCGVVFNASDLGSNVSYHWSLSSKPDFGADGKTVTLYFPSNGTYTITLTAKRKDCDENSAISLTKEVVVEGCNPCDPCVVEH